FSSGTTERVLEIRRRQKRLQNCVAGLPIPSPVHPGGHEHYSKNSERAVEGGCFAVQGRRYCQGSHTSGGGRQGTHPAFHRNRDRKTRFRHELLFHSQADLLRRRRRTRLPVAFSPDRKNRN